MSVTNSNFIILHFLFALHTVYLILLFFFTLIIYLKLTIYIILVIAALMDSEESETWTSTYVSAYTLEEFVTVILKNF